MPTPISNFLDGLVMRELTRLAGDVANTARQNASWSSRIPGAIVVGSVEKQGDGMWSITISIDKEKAPHAMAFERGTGIHSENESTYQIRPKNVSVLAIPLSRWDSFEPPVVPGKKMIRMGDVGPLLRYVDHPGVRARPFMQPAIEANRKSTRERFLGLLSKAYRSATIQVTTI